jgi:hypothetical protein
MIVNSFKSLIAPLLTNLIFTFPVYATSRARDRASNFKAAFGCSKSCCAATVGQSTLCENTSGQHRSESKYRSFLHRDATVHASRTPPVTYVPQQPTNTVGSSYIPKQNSGGGGQDFTRCVTTALESSDATSVVVINTCNSPMVLSVCLWSSQDLTRGGPQVRTIPGPGRYAFSTIGAFGSDLRWNTIAWDGGSQQNACDNTLQGQSPM